MKKRIERTTAMKKTPPKIYRQGDVLIAAVADIPTGASELPRGKRGVVLAEGEVTGHAHRIASRHAKLLRTEEDVRYMRVTAPVALRHEEHAPIEIPPGNYRVTLHHEYAPAELPRTVAD